MAEIIASTTYGDVRGMQEEAGYLAFKELDPNVEGMPEWPTFNAGSRLAMSLDLDCHVGEIERTDPNMTTQTLRL